MQECWEVFINTDMLEGRGSDVTLAFFTNEKDARDVAQGRGPMGTLAGVRKHKVFTSIEAFNNASR